MENLLLSLAGASLGLVLAVFGMGLLVEYANRFTVRTGEIGIDLPVLAFTISVAVAVAILLAWAPSLPGLQGLGSASGAAGGSRGGGASRFLSRFLVEFLFEVSGTDPATYAGVGAVLGTVAVIAAYFPAKRATRVEPMEALRSE